jgi:hypothetical protein
MTVLSDYLKATQGFIRDRGERYVNVDDLTGYINRARREIAERTQCIRVLTPISGSVFEIQITNPGSGYTNPIATISSPDFPSGAPPLPAGAQATATVQQIGGKISNISVSYGGSGYFQPTVTISDSGGGTGKGATATASVSPITVSQFAQEVYPFSAVPLQQFPGVDSIFAVKSVSFLYSNYRYSLPCYPFSVYNAIIRSYPLAYYYIPTVCAQYGQGVNGSIYMYPIPSSIYQFELDCFCLPTDMIDDGTFEAIPQPWADAVPYFSAHLAYLEMQNLNAAKFYLDLYDNMVHRYSAYARPGRATSPYGRWVWWGAAILPLLGMLGHGFA